MPLLQINTNSTPADTDAVVKAASTLVANMLSKPESYVMVILNSEPVMSFAGSNDATAHLKLKSLGLSESDTANYSAQLCQFIEQQLGISASRIYIEFAGPARHMWGWNGGTF